MPESKRRKNRHKRGEENAAASDSSVSGAEPFGLNDLEAEDESTPRWYVAVFVSLLILGLLWIAVYYVSQGAAPISAVGAWNIIIGFVFAMIGLFMAMRWK